VDEENINHCASNWYTDTYRRDGPFEIIDAYTTELVYFVKLVKKSIFHLQLQVELTITDPSSRQRGRYNITNPQMSKENVKEKGKLVAGPVWGPDTRNDWSTDCRP
jgi:hypothetical protein